MMSRPRKFLAGDIITDPVDVMRGVMAGQYIIERGKPQHPGWIGSQPMRHIINATEGGAYRTAIPNPEHPDNREAAE